MNRGEVWWINFDPSVGGEIQKVRPAIIISNDVSNRYLNRIQVVPLTSSTARLYPSEAYVSVNGRQSKALADQVATVSKARVIDRAGILSGDDLQRVEHAVKIQLGLT